MRDEGLGEGLGMGCIEKTKTALSSIDTLLKKIVPFGEKMRILGLGPFQPAELVLENGFEN